MTRKKKITPKEFKDLMQKIIDSSNDPESNHGDADNLLCEVLTSLGYDEGVKIFEQMDKWYA